MVRKEELDRKLSENLNRFSGKKQDQQSFIIPDGLVDTEKYLKSTIKILWILKEANSVDDDWDLRVALNKDIKTDTGLKLGWSATFTPIVYTTNGILNNEDWDTMGNLNKLPEMIDCLQQVGYINVKKVPGSSIADGNLIQKFYNENKELLHEQIKLINPEVIIFGNTYSYFEADFFTENFGKFQEDKSNHHLHIYANENRLLLHAYHPNNRSVTQKYYCNSIIEAVQSWKLSKNK